MTKKHAGKEEKDRERAAELYRQGLALHEQGEYRRARLYYERSLRLVEDEEVRAAYFKLLSAIGPM